MTKAHFLSSKAAHAINQYELEHRHPGRPRFEVSDVVHLFPGIVPGQDLDGTSPWHMPWPYGDRAGVYLVLCANQELLYVGKASMGQTIGKRLYCHFGGGDMCVFNVYGWPTPPRYVVTIAVPADSAFEAPALEEFLIRTAKPKLNICGM